MIEVFKKNEQTYGEFNNGEIIENKPIGFPGENNSLKAYSNLLNLIKSLHVYLNY